MVRKQPFLCNTAEALQLAAEGPPSNIPEDPVLRSASSRRPVYIWLGPHGTPVHLSPVKDGSGSLGPISVDISKAAQASVPDFFPNIFKMVELLLRSKPGPSSPSAPELRRDSKASTRDLTSDADGRLAAL